MSLYLGPVLNVSLEDHRDESARYVIMTLASDISNQANTVKVILIPDVFDNLVEIICRKFNYDVDKVLSDIADEDEDQADVEGDRELRKAALNRGQP